MTPPKALRKELHSRIADIRSRCHEAFPHHVGKLAQLDSHLDTVGMVVDDLHDTTPPLEQER